MTKVRAPLTFENALTRVAALIGWARTAEIVGHAERTVRNWSEPDTTAKVTLEAAFRLDVEFQAEGGEGAPFHQCYATRLDAELIAASPCRYALLAGVARAAREGGEAIQATIAAARPGAGAADVAIAEREIEEAIAAKNSILAALRAFAKTLTGRGEPPPRAPEVAPPAPG